MGILVDGVMAANMIAKLIMSFRDAGIEVTVENIDEQIKAEETRKEEGNKELFD